MTRPSDEQILAFLTGEAEPETRETVLAEVERSADFAAELRQAAQGLASTLETEAAQRVAPPTPSPTERRPTTSRSRALQLSTVPLWSLPLVAAAAAIIAFPLGIGMAPPPSADALGAGVPQDTEPSFMVVLQGAWPDAGMVGPDEASRRAEEYWGWADELAEEGRLVAAGDLAWESGIQLSSASAPGVDPGGQIPSDPDFMVGMFTVRAATYEEALEIARDCPHLRYGGSVWVRRVQMGFVTVPGMDDWS